MQEIENRIFKELESAGVEYEVHSHDPVYTCKQMAEFLHIDENEIAKSLLLKKSGGGHLLAVLPGRIKLDFNRLSKIANVSKIALAPVKEVEAIAGCSVGAVYPLGNILNLPTYFDKRVLDYEQMYFNPGSHTKSVRIPTKALISFVKPIITNFAISNVAQ